jgi:hypothetical protein
MIAMILLNTIMWAGMGLVLALVYMNLAAPPLHHPMWILLVGATAAALAGAASHITGSYGAIDAQLADLLTAFVGGLMATIAYGGAAKRLKSHHR